MAFLGVQKSDDIKQAQQIKVGDKVDLDFTFLVLDQGTEEPRSVKLGELIKGKKAVLFGLPGAYTTVCSSKHVPNFNERYEDLKKMGVDFIGCLSVNDPWVMREWSRQLNNDLNKVAMLADGEGDFHAKLGLLQYLPGLGIRARRYSLLVEDGVVKAVNIEEPGGKSYKISGPARMMEDLERLKSGSA
jgi:peroxiredoxin